VSETVIRSALGHLQQSVPVFVFRKKAAGTDLARSIRPAWENSSSRLVMPLGRFAKPELFQLVRSDSRCFLTTCSSMTHEGAALGPNRLGNRFGLKDHLVALREVVLKLNRALIWPIMHKPIGDHDEDSPWQGLALALTLYH